MLRISPRSIPSIGVALLSAGLAGAPAVHAAACNGQVQLDAEYYVTPVPGYASCVAAGDWNEDGHPDLAVAHGGSTLTILRGLGGFRMGPRQEIPVSVTSNWVVARDMDGDGHQDLVVTGDGGTRILTGDGNGGFLETETFPEPGVRAAVGDLDGDGRPDIVLASGAPQLSVILRGTGERLAIPAFQYGAYFAVLADFDHDGDLDVASDGTLVWLNDGHGHLGGPTSYPTLYCLPRYMAAGDVNGDGHLDLFGVTTQEGGGGGCDMLLLGNGDGTFQAPAIASVAQRERIQRPPRRAGTLAADGSPATGAHPQVTPQSPRHVPPGPEFVVLEDLNGDGRADPIRIGGDTGYELDGRLTIRGAHMACAADMDGDGKLDMVVAGYAIAIHPGNGDGTFRRNLATATRFAPQDVVLADLDGDGRRDVAMTSIEDELVIALTAPDGGFRRIIRDPISTYSSSIAIADFDGDGRADLIESGDGFYAGNGDGTFRMPPVPTEAFGVPGDFDEDGHVDLASPQVNSVRLYLGNGDGTFRSGPSIPVEALNVQVADMDHDGHLDLVATARGGAIAVVYGRGDGSAADIVEIPTTYFTTVSLGDLDGDGLLDMIAPSSMGMAVYLARGRTFVRSPYAGAPLGPAIGDLNGDGIADLFAGGVWLGHGDGTFDPPDVLFGPEGSAYLGDRDGDGLDDLIVAGSYDEDGYENMATVIMNRTARNRAPVTSSARASLARSWPPNGDLADVAIDGVTDPDGDPVTVTCVGVTQDEPVTGGRGWAARYDPADPDSTCADAAIAADGHARVRLTRDGSGNGRVYEIAFNATDGCGASSSGHVRVDVRHDQGRASVDDGQRFSSFGCRASFTGEDALGSTPSLAVRRLSPGRWAIRYTLATPAQIRLEVFDLLGRRTSALESGPKEAGAHERLWAPPAHDGVFFVRLTEDGRTLVRRCVVLD